MAQMIFRWLKKLRRKRYDHQPIPSEWGSWLDKDLPFYGRLTLDDQCKLQRLIQIFIPEKHWEGLDGFTLTPRIQVSIAAQACLLLLHLDHDYYRRVQSIFIYPTARRLDLSPYPSSDPSAEPFGFSGMASSGGTIILCWDAVKGGSMHGNDGRNVVFHEFAHALDWNDHLADGTPLLASKEQFNQWVDIMTQHYEELVHSRDGQSKGYKSVIREYGSTNPTEFFACATEAFFEKSSLMRRRLPDLYQLLQQYFQQNPADWSKG